MIQARLESERTCAEPFYQRARSTGDLVKHSFLKAILTDAHFWAPVVVLILGVGLLVAIGLHP
jgi:hypothetical protein